MVLLLAADGGEADSWSSSDADSSSPPCAAPRGRLPVLPMMPPAGMLGAIGVGVAIGGCVRACQQPGLLAAFSN